MHLSRQLGPLRPTCSSSSSSSSRDKCISKHVVDLPADHDNSRQLGPLRSTCSSSSSNSSSSR
jgi:hypothetical protein